MLQQEKVKMKRHNKIQNSSLCIDKNKLSDCSRANSEESKVHNAKTKYKVDSSTGFNKKEIDDLQLQVEERKRQSIKINDTLITIKDRRLKYMKEIKQESNQIKLALAKITKRSIVV